MTLFNLCKTKEHTHNLLFQFSKTIGIVPTVITQLQGQLVSTQKTKQKRKFLQRNLNKQIYCRQTKKKSLVFHECAIC